MFLPPSSHGNQVSQLNVHHVTPGSKGLIYDQDVFLFSLMPAAGFNPEEQKEIAAARMDVLGMLPGESDWPYVDKSMMFGPHLLHLEVQKYILEFGFWNFGT